MSRKLGKRSMNLDVPAELYDMYSKLCIDVGITKTEGIVRYFRYLQAKHHKNRRMLDENSNSDFTLDAGEPR